MRVLVDVTNPETQDKLLLIPLVMDSETLEELSEYEGIVYPYIILDITDKTLTYEDKCTNMYEEIEDLPRLLI